MPTQPATPAPATEIPSNGRIVPLDVGLSLADYELLVALAQIDNCPVSLTAAKNIADFLSRQVRS